jgi:hypothetical protein
MLPFWIEVESSAMVQWAAFIAAGFAAWCATGAMRGIRA